MESETTHPCTEAGGTMFMPDPPTSPVIPVIDIPPPGPAETSAGFQQLQDYLAWIGGAASSAVETAQSAWTIAQLWWLVPIMFLILLAALLRCGGSKTVTHNHYRARPAYRSRR